ncbi:MAG TPA: prepilin-type N-terminal cleavage/methylation domain-containing protein [Phycisphaerae bacterium]|nr:prepilin-type N-terminal cleavage/methylation domain-containing protein [Phycisphaerae bacterium]
MTMMGNFGRPRRRTPKGFTLMEVLITSVIISVGITAVMAAIGSGTRVNEAGISLTKAGFLAQEIREWSMNLDDLDSLTSVTYSPPRNSLGVELTNMAGWSQDLTVTWRSSTDLDVIVPSDSSDIAHIWLAVWHNDELILSTDWLVVRKE